MNNYNKMELFTQIPCIFHLSLNEKAVEDSQFKVGWNPKKYYTKSKKISTQFFLNEY